VSLKVVFLGTGGSVPTPKRSLPAIVIERKGEQIMFDCGEGVQRQMIKAKTGFHRKMKVFISHMHGDHVLGLPGMLQTMALLNRERKIDIYGPLGIKNFLECVKETVQFVLTFEVEIHEMESEGVICDEKEYYVQTVRSNHVIPSLAYAFVEKSRPGKFYPEKAESLGVPEGPLWSELQSGKSVKLSNGRVILPKEVMGKARTGRKVVYSGDTRPFGKFVRFTANADMLIHDATLGDELTERAKEDGHSTPTQAAEIAKKAKVKKLVLTHISARYNNAEILLKQAKKLFKNTVVAEDFMKLEIPLLDS